MAKASLADLRDDARVWVFGAPRALTETQTTEVLRQTQRFLESWISHGAAIRGAADLIDNTLLVIAVEEGDDPSGCSIDTLFRFAQQLGMLESGRVFYREADGIRSATRSEFRKLVEQGTVTDDTVVIDTTAERLGQIRAGLWEKRFADSWHAAV